MFVKICGLQTPETVQATVDAGADAVGFVFAPGSVRFVEPEAVQELVSFVPDSVETVGVFRNQPIAEVLNLAKRSGVKTVQLHGFETQNEVLAAEQAGFRVMRALDIETYRTLSEKDHQFHAGRRLLIDAVEPGSGKTFDGSGILDAPPSGWWLLAGGLTSENVALLLQKFKPTGVDVSSGVEGTRGVKDIDKIRSFIETVRSLE